MKNNLRRFFYHFRKQTKGMTVHYKNQCIAVKNVVCNCPAETKWSDKQPRLVMRGYCNNVKIENDTAYIN